MYVVDNDREHGPATNTGVCLLLVNELTESPKISTSIIMQWFSKRVAADTTEARFPDDIRIRVLSQMPQYLYDDVVLSTSANPKYITEHRKG